VNILALDTATEELSLCLAAGGQTSIWILRAGLKHSQTLLPGIQALLREAGITAAELQLIVCSLGPGSFTGIRIGLAAAKGLAFGCGCPLVGASTLDALAYRFASFPGVVVPVMSSLRKMHYSALYREGKRISAYLDLSLTELAQKLAGFKQALLTGPQAGGLFKQLPREATFQVFLDSDPSATNPQALLELGRRSYLELGAGEAELKPLYLRQSEAKIMSRGDQSGI